MVALSFVREPHDVVCLRELIQRQSATASVIAKIERPEAWQRIDEILQVSDGVMVARGDLGVEVEMGHVPHIQKTIIEKARGQNRFVITATHMLESMIENAVPTRAEVSDIANAVYDGTDALMLSGETARGKHPIDAVRVMSEIACASELHSPADPPQTLETSGGDDAEIIADAACRASAMRRMRAIAVFTVTGRTAHLIAARRPAVPIFAFTSTPAVARRLSVWYGVTALVAPPLHSLEDMANYMDRELLQRRQLEPGNHVLFVAGDQVGTPGTTNVLKVHTAITVSATKSA
jgi:pyruvate kinase